MTPQRRVTRSSTEDLRAIGLDLGAVRIGVAVCDSGGVLATPLETVRRSGNRTEDHRRIRELAEEAGARHIVVGVPYSLDGTIGPAARQVVDEVEALRSVVGDRVAVHVQDERFTTITASEAMRTLGIKPKRRRQIVDQIAAAVILQSWLDHDSHFPAGGPTDPNSPSVPPTGDGSS